MKLYIFSGFLGSGKTLSIISFAQYLTKDAKEGDDSGAKKLAVLENEIGKVNFDDTLLKGSNLEVLNLLSGCICCTLTTDLIETLNELNERYSPENVIFEPTGLAFPDRIVENVEKHAENIETIKTITIADAERWDKLFIVTPMLIEAQLKAADIILLNKVDLIENSLDSIREKINELNPDAEVFEISALNGIDDKVWNEVTSCE